MSDYLKSTNFATKDALPSGNAGKIVKGTEIDNEFNAIADAVESKADLLNPVFSGLLTTDTLATGGAANIGGTLAVTGNTSMAGNLQMTGTGFALVPKGTTAQRPASPASGYIRYNTDLGYLENYTGTVWQAVGYVTPADVSDEVNTATGYFQVPVGTTGQRPATPVNGLIRYNTTKDFYEGYYNSNWLRFQTYLQGEYTLTYVLAAGGGGGALGGGGGGGLIANTTTAIPTTVYTITIGAGGATSANGSNSSITGIATATGGGAGGTYSGNGASGGSGGGGTGGDESHLAGYAGGAGTTGQGFAGGGGGTNVGAGQSGCGGGGGAGGAGAGGASNTSGGVGGNGGAGYTSSITGISVSYAGGGGGGGGGSAAGGTGTGGGGNGGGTASAGGTNTGGGGGGGTFPGGTAAAGGSGVCFISMPTINYTGTTTGTPTVTTYGSTTVLKYTASGTYTA